MNHGFLRVAACAPSVRPADVEFNVCGIIDALRRMEEDKVELTVFPEMCITAYTCADLFHNTRLLDAASGALLRLRDLSRGMRGHFVVGLPIRYGGSLGARPPLVPAGDGRSRGYCQPFCIGRPDRQV